MDVLTQKDLEEAWGILNQTDVTPTVVFGPNGPRIRITNGLRNYKSGDTVFVNHAKTGTLDDVLGTAINDSTWRDEYIWIEPTATSRWCC
jgi:hypothetical protein